MSVSGSPRALLRLEGAVVLAVALFGYRATGGSWAVFAVLFLLPDLSMLGYLRGARFGSMAYNAVHTYVAPALLAALAVAGVVPNAWPFCLTWVAHIGFDRVMGFGLKYPSAFRDTHLGPIGRTGRRPDRRDGPRTSPVPGPARPGRSFVQGPGGV